MQLVFPVAAKLVANVGLLMTRMEGPILTYVSAPLLYVYVYIHMCVPLCTSMRAPY